MPATMTADRMYGIEYRPQELALYGDRASFRVRCAPMFDDPAEIATTHYRVMVLEIHVTVPAGAELGPAGGQLQVLRIGWELTLEASPAVQVGTLPELPAEIARLLERIADTVNGLARRAGLEAPLGPEVITQLQLEYSTRA